MKSTLQATVDVGNTRTKAGVFVNGRLEEWEVFEYPTDLATWLKAKQPDRIAVCLSGDPSWLDYLHDLPPPLLLHWQTPTPIRNSYGTPQTLGMDRLASVVGAYSMFPGEACMVIDAGTCITLDYLTSDGEYLGGVISPGLKMRLKAMHTFTASLPMINDFADYEIIGKSTKACMLSGALHGACMEIEGFIRDFSEKFGRFKVILSGGDSNFFENRIKATIFVDQHLTLSGLNCINEFNAC